MKLKRALSTTVRSTKMVNIMDMACLCQKQEIDTTKVNGLMVKCLAKVDCFNLVLLNT